MTVGDTGSASDGMVDSSAMVAGDKYLMSFTVDDSVLCFSTFSQFGGVGGIWLNPVISFTLTALPGNTGAYTPGSFTIASSYVQIEQPDNTSSNFEVSVELAGGNAIGFTYMDWQNPGGDLSADSAPLTSAMSAFSVAHTPVSGTSAVLADYIPSTWSASNNWGSLTFGDRRIGGIGVPGTPDAPTVTTVPEPSSLALIGLAAGTALLLRRRQRVV